MHTDHLITHSSAASVTEISLAMQHGNTLLHIVAGKGNYGALKAFLDFVQLPEMNVQNQVN